MWILLCALTLLPQDEALIRALVEKLGADALAEREEAWAELKKAGVAASPELRKAAEGANAVRAGLAKQLLKRVQVLESVGPGFLREFPDAVDKLAFGPDSEWAKYFLQAESKRIPKSRQALLATTEFEALADRALAADGWRMQILAAIERRRIRSVDTRLTMLMVDSDERVREAVLAAAGRPLREPFVRRLLEIADGEKAWMRSHAIRELGIARAREAVPIITRRSQSENWNDREASLRALARIQGADAIPFLKTGLK